MARYTAPINIRYTGTTSAGSTVWSLTTGGSPIQIKRIVLFSAFDGTAAGTTARHELRRFRSATPTGGTAVAAVPKNLDSPASSVNDIRMDLSGAALTVTGVTFDAPMMLAGACPRGASGSVVVLNLDTAASPFIVDAGDGICIQNQVAAVVGDVIAGFIEWEE